jgi:hypothetical protein
MMVLKTRAAVKDLSCIFEEFFVVIAVVVRRGKDPIEGFLAARLDGCVVLLVGFDEHEALRLCFSA